MRAGNEGLRGKYIVHKAETGEEVNSCFVLRPDKDAAAVDAIRAYAAVTDNKVLAADLIRWVGTEPDDPLTLEKLREMGGEPVWVERNDGANSRWAIVGDFESLYGVYFGTKVGGMRLPYEEYGKTWTAYRRKPEEDRNAET